MKSTRSYKLSSIGMTCYLLSTDDSSWLSLDDHVLGSPKVQSCRSKMTRFVEILHDVSDLLRLKLHTSIHEMDQNLKSQLSHNKSNMHTT